MKNVDPRSGLRQIITGKLYLPRRRMVELLRNKRINPNLLGYYLIAIVSADWDDGEYRYGLIRHEVDKLAGIWRIPSSTLYSNFKELRNVGLLSKKNNLFEVDSFDDFQTPGGQFANKNKVDDDYLEHFFKDLLFVSEIRESNSSKITDSLRVPNKDELIKENDVPPRQLVRTYADYLQIYKDGGYTLLLPDDMKWLDEHYGIDGSFIP